MKIFVVGGANNYANFLNGELVDNYKKADLILFTGGEDVSPSLYGCARHITTNSNKARDTREQVLFSKLSSKQVCLGICRGLN